MQLILHIFLLGFDLFQAPEVTFANAVSACESANMTIVKDDSATKHASIQIYLMIIENLQRYVSDSLCEYKCTQKNFREF